MVSDQVPGQDATANGTAQADSDYLAKSGALFAPLTAAGETRREGMMTVMDDINRRWGRGTLRYLALLAILLDPEPPPLLLIEEPELALHPDVLPTLRDLMLEASERTQIIATTHSPSFLDAWSERPEVVLICERDEEGTRLERLPPTSGPRTRSLGSRWMSGELGGTRW